MATHEMDPNGPHQALVNRLHGVVESFPAMPPAEKLAMVAQFLGQLIATMPDQFSKRDVMQAVAGNMAAGNQQASGGHGGSILDANGGLLG